MFISDIDGTLLNTESEISIQNLTALRRLKKQNTPIVLATGRNLFSVRKVISLDFPVDYIIFSTGLGIIDWKTQQIIFSTKLKDSTVQLAAEYLVQKEISFFMQNELPENHFFYAFKSKKVPDDFYRRLSVYQNFVLKYENVKLFPNNISQIIAVLENGSDIEFFNKIENVNIIRSSSPLDHKSIWMELFPPNISKGFAIKSLCDYINYSYDKTMSVGNDYNDLEMLEFTKYSYCVANAPNDLKEKYETLASNNQNGVEHAVKLYERVMH